MSGFFLKAGITGLSLLAFLGLQGCATSPPDERVHVEQKREYNDNFDYYDFYEAGYDVTEDYDEDDWFYDYYDYSPTSEFYYDYGYDDEWVEEEYEWEEDGLFRFEDQE